VGWYQRSGAWVGLWPNSYHIDFRVMDFCCIRWNGTKFDAGHAYANTSGGWDSNGPYGDELDYEW